MLKHIVNPEHKLKVVRMKIKNQNGLLSYGDIDSRQILLDITEEVLEALDAGNIMRNLISRDGSLLKIGDRCWDLSQKDHIYLLGAGKACNAMSIAIEEILGEYLTMGIVSVKILEKNDNFKKTKVFVGGHPLPNQEGQQAAMEMLALARSSTERDLFICVMSGGSSALLSCPAGNITLEEEIEATDILLKLGANIKEINAVRRHISGINGGRLAQIIQSRKAEMIGFAIRDSLGLEATNDISIPVPNYSATPIGCDDTTIADAKLVIEKYHLTDLLPKNVMSYINSLSYEEETPKAFPEFTYYVLNTVIDSCLIAERIAKNKGIKSIILTASLEGEAREAGRVLASIAREIQQSGNPIKAPCLVISAGEVTVHIDKSDPILGHGGPSQEMAAGFAVAASNIRGAAFLSIDSEGTDGTTMVAGGITDSQTQRHAKDNNIDIIRALDVHAAGEALEALNCAVKTGNTGTNLCDFNLMYIPEK